MEAKETITSPWKKVAEQWDKYYAPPGRPSAEDCEHYARFIEKSIGSGQARALVLGSTPEVRNVLHRYPIEVTIMDANLEMILGMNATVPKSEQDKIVRANWTEDLLADNYFDLVLGDLTWANIPRKDWEMFNKNISRVLKQGGHYIQRVTTIPDNWEFKPIEETLSRYETLPATSQLHFELFIHLLIDSYDPATHTLSIDRIRESLKPYWNNGQLVGEKYKSNVGDLIGRIFSFWGDDSKTWETDYSDKLHESIDPYFEPLEETVSGDYLNPEASPFWFSKVKK